MSSGFSFIRRSWLTIEAILNGVLMTIFILALLSPIISPRWFLLTAYANMGYIVILAATVLVWIAYIILRKKRYILIYTILLAISYPYSSTYIPFHPFRSSPEEHDLRVLSYNVMGFRYKEGKEYKAAQLITHYDPDIACLQEASNTRDSTHIVRTFGKRYKHIRAYLNPHSKVRGLVVLSKFPILQTIPIYYPSGANGSCMLLLQMPHNQTLLLVNNHMESYEITQKERSSYREVIKRPTKVHLPKFIRHLYNRLGDKLFNRAYAAQRVREELHKAMESYHPDMVILTGDLNDPPKSYTYSKLRGDMHDAYAERGNGFGWSFNERLFPFRIDHLFYKGSLTAVDVQIPWSEGYSDHNPLIVDFKYPDSSPVAQ